MPIAAVNGLDIAYETEGNPGHPAVLLVAGAGGQLTDWRADAVTRLAREGYFVIRFDNRDAGLSSKVDARKANLLKVYSAVLAGERPEVPYTLSDMAADGIGLLEHLGVGKAHAIGVSMGGMIVQTMAIEYPERLLSLVSMMSSTGDHHVGQATPEATTILLHGFPPERDQAIQAIVDGYEVTWGPHFFDETRARRQATEAYDRTFYPEGTGRQLAAVLASGDRTEALRAVTVPALVIHGECDPLVDVSGGHATAAALPHADLLVVDDMGHDVPPEREVIVYDAIVSHLRRHTP